MGRYKLRISVPGGDVICDMFFEKRPVNFIVLSRQILGLCIAKEGFYDVRVYSNGNCIESTELNYCDKRN